MTKDQQIEYIKEACCKANPEIMELKFGCSLMTEKGETARILNQGNGTYGEWYTYLDNEGLITTSDAIGNVYEILGRDIQLADVLLAIGKKEPTFDWAVCLDGRIMMNIDESSYFECTDYSWNLLLPLHLQSDETILFICNLLK